MAYTLTRFEYCRTDDEFENSYIYKAVIFQFINYYGALFYMVFMRSSNIAEDSGSKLVMPYRSVTFPQDWNKNVDAF